MKKFQTQKWKRPYTKCVEVLLYFIIIPKYRSFTQITSAGDDDVKLRDIALNTCDVSLSCGFTKPIGLLKHQDIHSIIESVTLHTVILQVRGEGGMYMYIATI